MKRTPLLFILIIGTLSCCRAQDLQGYAMNDYIRKHVPLDMGAGAMAYVCDRNFGYDSSYVELLLTDDLQATTGGTSNSLNTALTFMDDAAKLTDGILVCGGNSLAMMLMLDNTGAVQWYKGFSSDQIDQDQLVAAVPNGNAFSAYSYPGGSFADHFFRVEGDVAGSSFTGTKVQAPAQLRVYTATATSAPVVQLAGGTGYEGAMSSHLQALLVKSDASGALWMKLYDLGDPSGSVEMYGVLPLSDGDFLCSGYAYGSGPTYQGFAMKLDAAGTVIWCEKLSDVSGGLFLNQATELADGSLLLAGSNAAYQGLLVKLDASGASLSTRLFTADRLLTFHRTNGQLSVHGPNTMVQLDDAGNGCGLTDESAVTVQVISPTVTSLAVTNTAVSFTPSSLTTATRTPVLQWNSTCTFTAVEEQTGNRALLRPWPVPTHDKVWIGGSGIVYPTEPFRLLDAQGLWLAAGRYGDGIDLSGLASGTYIVELPAQGEHFIVVKD